MSLCRSPDIKHILKSKTHYKNANNMKKSISFEFNDKFTDTQLLENILHDNPTTLRCHNSNEKDNNSSNSIDSNID